MMMRTMTKNDAGAKERWWRFFPEITEAQEQQKIQQQELAALETESGDKSRPKRQSLMDKYKNYPLALSMIQGESIRNEILIRDGWKQGEYTKSNHGWIKTLFVITGRALDNIALPWTVVTINAIFWTLLNEYAFTINYGFVENWEIFIGLVVNTSLSFLLVFRLNRAAERFWLARQTWGRLVADIRNFVSGIEAHGAHDPVKRDIAIRWVAAFPIATMQYMRDIPDVPPGMLSGILSLSNVELLVAAPHPPLYASNQVRVALTDLFCITADTPSGMAHAWALQMDTLEKTLNNMMDQEGAMERIRSTPLPLVYVAHLRTFLLLFLLSLPYVWYPSWGWSTIPIVFITSFAMLGLEGSAMEVECPFRRDRTNHLDMDDFCLVALSTIQQTVCEATNRDIEKSKTRRNVKEFASADVRSNDRGPAEK